MSSLTEQMKPGMKQNIWLIFKISLAKTKSEILTSGICVFTASVKTLNKLMRADSLNVYLDIFTVCWIFYLLMFILPLVVLSNNYFTFNLPAKLTTETRPWWCFFHTGVCSRVLTQR